MSDFDETYDLRMRMVDSERHLRLTNDPASADVLHEAALMIARLAGRCEALRYFSDEFEKRANEEGARVRRLIGAA